MSVTPEEPEVSSIATPEDAVAERAKLEADVAKSAKRVMNHMNGDHEDSLVVYVLAFATGVEGTDPETGKEDALLRNIRKGMLTITSAKLTAVDADGFLMEIKAVECGPSSEVLVLSNVRVPYHEPLRSARDLHHTAVAMHRMAYDRLGVWYKTKNGYYQQVLKIVAFQSYKAAQKSVAPNASVLAGATALVAATAAAGYLRHRSRTA